MYDSSLVYELDADRRLVLTSGTLSMIDSETMIYTKSSELMQKYKSRIIPFLSANKDYIDLNPDNKGRFVIDHIKAEDEKEELEVIFNNGEYKPILLRSVPVSIENLKSHIQMENSEVELARKLILSSKNKKFLVMFLKDTMFSSTIDRKIKVSKQEYDEARSIGVDGFIKNGQFGLTIRETLAYLYKSNRLGSMRMLVEDALELWKKGLEQLDDDELYYYSRELRILMDDYYENINYRNKAVTNLQTNEERIPLRKIELITDTRYYETLKKGKLEKTKRLRAA